MLFVLEGNFVKFKKMLNKYNSYENCFQTIANLLEFLKLHDFREFPLRNLAAHLKYFEKYTTRLCPNKILSKIQKIS